MRLLVERDCLEALSLAKGIPVCLPLKQDVTS